MSGNLDESQELFCVGQAISQLDDKRCQLKRELKEVKLSLARQRARFAEINNRNVPVAKLPPEVLSMIFEAGNRLDPPYHQIRKRSSTWSAQLPFRSAVSCVSRHWRTVALHLCGLWKVIRINNTCGVDLAILDAVLARSGAAGLTLTFGSKDAMPPSPTRSLVLMNLMCNHIQRWESFTLQMDTMQILHDVGGQLRRAYAPRLRKFTVGTRRVNSMRIAAPSISLFQGGAPSLRDLVYNCMSPHTLFPPCHAITSLELSTRSPSMSLNEFRDFLNSFVSLERLIIRDDCTSQWPAIDTFPACVPVTLPCLRSICIAPHDDLYPGQTTFILAFILAPVLDTVVFKNILAFDPGFVDTLKHLHASSPCRLPSVRNLSVDDCPWDNDDAEGIMEAFPQLSHLVFDVFDPCTLLLRSSEGTPLGLDVHKITFRTALVPAHARGMHELLEDRCRKGLWSPPSALPGTRCPK
ncbi:hypothetical protein PLICRDRAFT_47294 [Plicaturopsis crispa FD-325 SS-3]|uniref:F-box domain-containing protein n=1 Tax=Plicaturopsis crispa FD-325 SS-3 TaxID=944288 RepID=A0A0C9SW11_PLICR|nr:hypothetical protein PLICRDRAFT_47294 [Plicaturopsis crispa FD-325 SS-3]